LLPVLRTDLFKQAIEVAYAGFGRVSLLVGAVTPQPKSPSGALLHRNLWVTPESDGDNPGRRPMEKAVAYATSALIVGIGVWIFVAGLASSSPVLWSVVAIVAIVVGLVSAFGPI